MSHERDKDKQEQQPDEQTGKPTDALSLAGQSFGIDREEVFDLVLSLKTDSGALSTFAQNTADLDPEDRLRTLKELAPIAGSVEATNVLLVEAGVGPKGRNALYLIGAAQERTSLRFEPLEGKASSLDKEFRVTRRTMENLQKAAVTLSNSLTNLSGPSAEEVELAVRAIGNLVPLKVAQELNREVERVVASAKADESSVSTKALAQLRESCLLAIDAEVGSLRESLEENRTRESRTVGDRGSFEMAVWSQFADFFGIDDRDFESQWGLLQEMRKVFGGHTWTQNFKIALQIGKDIQSNIIHDVMRHAERGFEVEEGLLSVDNEDYHDHSEEHDGWDGSEGWT